MSMPVDRPYKIPGRPPKLTREQADRLIYLWTTGTSKNKLAQMFDIDNKVVTQYIVGKHKHPALRMAE